MLRLRTKKVLIAATGSVSSTPDAEAVSEVSFSSMGRSVPLEEGSTYSEDSCKESSYLLIQVHEARNLVAKDYETNSSDPFVRVTLGPCSKKTRVIYRNCHPLWEQQLLFPLDGTSENEPLTVKVFERNNFSKAKQFLGQNAGGGYSKQHAAVQVLMTLGKALEIAQDAVTAQNYWFGLSKSRSTDIVGGELCLGFRVLDPLSYIQIMNVAENQMDNDTIAKMLASKSLHIWLKGINGLQASGLIGDSPASTAAAQQQHGKLRRPPSASAKGLSLFVKFGHMTIEKPLPELTAECEGSIDEPGSFELTVHEEVFIPLAKAVQAAPPLAARRRDELFDVKLYIKSGSTTIAKTQIPIWDIPSVDSASTNAESPLAAPEPNTNCNPTAPATNSMPGSPRCTSEGLQPASPSPPPPTGGFSKLLMGRAASLAASGLNLRSSNSDSLGSESAPTTPRATGRLGFNLSGALLYPRIPSASTAAAEQDPAMRSAKSEANLAKMSTISTASTAKDMYVEGSLHSVTACSKPPQHHAHANNILAKRKVQGLSELNDNFRAAFKSMLIPGREVSRMGWVPTRRSQFADEGVTTVQAVDLGLKHYCRLMESYVPMHAHLELGVAMQLLPQIQPDMHAAPSEAADDAGGIDSDDSEAVPDAAPITLPEPYNLVLLDEFLHLGVNSVHVLLFGSDSEFMLKHNASLEDLTEMVVGPWRPGGADSLKTRQVSYTKKLNIPVPLAPKQCHVWEEHRILVKQDGGFVAEHVCTNDAPKGDCFRALIQICGVFVSAGRSRLRISMMLDWHKNCLGKGIVQTGAEADSKRSWGRLVTSLKQHAASKEGLGLPLEGVASPGTSSRGGAVTAARHLAAVDSKQSTKLGWLAGAVPGSSAFAAAGMFIAVVTLLMVLVAVVWSGAKGVSQAARHEHGVEGTRECTVRECSTTRY